MTWWAMGLHWLRLIGCRKVARESWPILLNGISEANFAFVSTWPAFWTCTAGNWPAGGEIDIVEGANDQGPRNLASLHTTPGCSIPSGQGTTSNRNDSGTSYNADCANQPGCSVGFSAQNSFGPDFNRNGGGYFAMVRDTAPGGRGISVHFWPATAGNNTPAALLNPPLSYLSTFANTSSPAYSTQSIQWSNPAAHFPNSASCNMENYFGRHNIIFDTTLCGYWAGETFPYVSGCPKNITCEDFVRGMFALGFHHCNASSDWSFLLHW